MQRQLNGTTAPASTEASTIDRRVSIGFCQLLRDRLTLFIMAIFSLRANFLLGPSFGGDGGRVRADEVLQCILAAAVEG